MRRRRVREVAEEKETDEEQRVVVTVGDGTASVAYDVMRGLVAGGASRQVVAAAAEAIVRSAPVVTQDNREGRDVVSRIASAAAECLDLLDRFCCKHRHALAVAVGAVARAKTLPEDLLTRTRRVATSADAVRRVTVFSLET